MIRARAAPAATLATATATALSTLRALAPNASAASLVQVGHYGENPTGLPAFERVAEHVSVHSHVPLNIHWAEPPH